MTAPTPIPLRIDPDLSVSLLAVPLPPKNGMGGAFVVFQESGPITTSHHVRSIISDTLGVIPEAVHDLTPLPKHNDEPAPNDRCDRCRIGKALGIDDDMDWFDAATVGDLVRFIEAREAGDRG